METKEALTKFLKDCEERGLSPETRRTYHSFLRHFVDEHPELPTDTKIIEAFLKKRKETPGRRGGVFKRLQAFYTYLERAGIVEESPVPPRAPMGRPQKAKVVDNPGTGQLELSTTLPPGKVGQGGTKVLPGSTSTSISTADAVESFIRSRKVQGVSPRTMEGYYSRFRPFLRKYPTLPLTVEPIVDFLGSIQGTPENRWTYRRHLIALYHFLEERKKIPKDLFKFPLVKVPRKVRRVLSEEEMRRLFSYAQNFTEKAILILLIDSKVRAGELCKLTREKVYPDHITVMEKGGGERDVPIKPEVYDMLVQLAPSGILFRFEGRPIRREYLRIILRRLMHRAGLKGAKLGPHILRHSASVQHMVHGGDLLSLKDELGHTTTKMTEIYGQLAFTQVKDKHQQVDVLGKVLNGEPLDRLPLERAKCYGCQKEILLELAKIKETECPDCHQVGKWYLPDHPGGVQCEKCSPNEEGICHFCGQKVLEKQDLSPSYQQEEAKS